MSRKKVDQYLEITNAGAFVQALDLAAKSDRLARRDAKARDRTRAREIGVAALRHRLLRSPWTIGAILFAVALALDVLSG